MQLYHGLPVITNKITTEETKGVPHHLLGCIGLEEETWTVGKFVNTALGVVSISVFESRLYKLTNTDRRDSKPRQASCSRGRDPLLYSITAVQGCALKGTCAGSGREQGVLPHLGPAY